MSISPWKGVGAQKIDTVEILNFTGKQITFSLGLNAAKNTHNIQKRFKRKLFRIHFTQERVN